MANPQPAPDREIDLILIHNFRHGELDLENARKEIKSLIAQHEQAAKAEYHEHLRNQRRLLLENTNLENRPDSFRNGYVCGMDELLGSGLAELTTTAVTDEQGGLERPSDESKSDVTKPLTSVEVSNAIHALFVYIDTSQKPWTLRDFSEWLAEHLAHPSDNNNEQAAPRQKGSE